MRRDEMDKEKKKGARQEQGVRRRQSEERGRPASQPGASIQRKKSECEEERERERT